MRNISALADQSRTTRPSPVAEKNYARDPSHGKPPNWGALYRTYCPEHTDGCSRHAKIIASEILRNPKSPVRRMLIDAGYEPDHWASSIEVTVEALWKERAALKQNAPDFWQQRRDEQYRAAGLSPPQPGTEINDRS